MDPTAFQEPSVSKMRRAMRLIVVDKPPCTCAAVVIQPRSPSAMGVMRSEGLWDEVSRRDDHLPDASGRPWRRPVGTLPPCDAAMTHGDRLAKATFSGGCCWCLQPPFDPL